MSKTQTVRVMILCDVRGRIVAAMPAMPAVDSKTNVAPLPGAAGVVATKGRRLYEIEVPRDLLSADGGMSELVESYVVRTARGTRSGPQLIKRRAGAARSSGTPSTRVPKRG